MNNLIPPKSTVAYVASILHIAVFTLLASTRPLLAETPEPLAELNIELVDNRVQISVPVENYNLRLALDTGASRTVIFQSKKYSFDDLPSLDETNVIFPALDEVVTGKKLAPISISFGYAVFSPEKPILIQQRPPIGDRLSFEFDGILGRDFFRNYVVEIEPKTLRLRLYPKGTNLRSKFKTQIPLYMSGEAPHIRFRSVLPWEKNPSMKELLLDTGYPGAMVIWDKQHFKRAAGTEAITTYQDENKGIITLARFKVGQLRFERVPLFVASKQPKQAYARDGLIGSNVLVQFHHVIDFGGEQLLLASRRTYWHRIDGGFYPPNNEGYVVKDYREISTSIKHTVG